MGWLLANCYYCVKACGSGLHKKVKTKFVCWWIKLCFVNHCNWGLLASILAVLLDLRYPLFCFLKRLAIVPCAYFVAYLVLAIFEVLLVTFIAYVYTLFICYEP